MLASPAWARLDPIDTPLDELLNVGIVSAPKFAESPDQIPSAVSILTAEDIRLYGWRTLSDALRTLQGFNASNDHTYDYVGMRGVSKPGDYRPRLQILIDGQSINDNILAMSPADTSFPLDIALVERIEVIRGPSASIYGGDAIFGVINVVTRSGQSIKGGEAGLTLGSGKDKRLRATWGGVIDNKDVLISYANFDADGRSLMFKDLNPDGSPMAIHHIGAEQGEQLLVKVRGGDWGLSFIHARRDREVTNGSYGTIPNDRSHVETDNYNLLNISKEWILNPSNALQQSFYMGTFSYDAKFPYDYLSDGVVTNVDKMNGSWWGLESRLVNTGWSGQRWTLGFEFKANTRQNLLNYDTNNQNIPCFGYSASAPCLDSRQQSQQATFMAQDEIQIGYATLLTIGLRHDDLGSLGKFSSPRLGLVHDADAAGLFKILYGTAFRAPSAYERAYNTPFYRYGNPNLDPEKMQSLELTWEKQLSRQSRLSATLYHLQISRMISAYVSQMATNGTRTNASGLELEYEQRWSNGSRLRTGYSLQRATDENGALDNSPRHMVKLNLAVPTGIPHLMAGTEGQWISARKAYEGTEKVAPYLLVNLNLSYAPTGRNWDTSLGIYNLFNHGFSDPVAIDNTTALTRWQMPQLGRSFMLRSTLRF
jgi:iron complex outermembrane receptor protein